MLVSPGNSPRHLSSSSPAPSQSQPQVFTPTVAASPSNPAASSSSNKRRAAVLDEDAYVAAIEKIIERDFFPDLPKLRDRLDLLEALRTGDPVLIRDAQLKIMDRRRNKSASNPTGSTRRTATPGSSLFPTFSATPLGSDKTRVDPALATGDRPELEIAGIDVSSLSLDDFLRRYTSEDNESFSKIIDKVNKRKREKYAHLLEGEKEPLLLTSEEQKRERITDGYGTSGQPVCTLDGCKFTAKNLLMYYPADQGEVPLTQEEREERLMALTKEIDRPNTRLHGRTVDSIPKEEEASKILFNMVPGTTPSVAAYKDPEKSKKYDLEELRRTQTQFYIESHKKAENGYSFVKTPSPAPGVDESPFMTWGEIDGTPLRLDMEDAAMEASGSAGPQFKMPLPPVRDVKAHLLSREAARKIRERSKLFKKPPLPSPSRGRSASPNVRTLSPAAQKFMRNAIKKSSQTIDETLRASYRGSSPLMNTPKERSRFSREASLGSTPPARQNSATPW